MFLLLHCALGLLPLICVGKKGNVSRWSISSSKANTLPSSHHSLHLTLLSQKGLVWFVFFLIMLIILIPHNEEESRLFPLFS